MAEINQLSPKAPYDDNRASPEYPWYSGSNGRNGNRNITYADPTKPDKSYVETVNHDGSFSIVEAGGLTNTLENSSRAYVSGGGSRNTDGNSAEYGQSNKNTAFKQDVGLTSGGNAYQGVAGQNIEGSGKGSFQNQTDGKVYTSTKSDIVTVNQGSLHVSNEGDTVMHVTGNRMMITEGDYGNHVQGGNLDYNVAQKIKIYSGEELVIVSALKITLNVGNNKITIDENGVQIDSTGYVNLNASGDIKTQGATTKIQGGGTPTATPRTFV